MGEMKIGIYCYLIADILTKLFQKCSLSGPLPNMATQMQNLQKNIKISTAQKLCGG